MGLFDWLGGGSEEPEDDFKPKAAPVNHAGGKDKPKGEADAKPSVKAQPLEKPPVRAPAAAKPSKAEDMPEFGIQKAIELMRDLPSQNVELVVQVVKKTLESMEVDVATIVDDAKSKQAKIQGRIKGLEDEIADFKEEIAGREEEIAALKSDFAETRLVRERLELAQKGMAKGDVVAPPTGRGPGAAKPAAVIQTAASSSTTSGQAKS
jgi:hypothetical protein